jgi:hypothetical protein
MMKMVRTEEDIFARWKYGDDVLGLAGGDLVGRLSFDFAKSKGIVKEGVEREEWERGTLDTSVEGIKREMVRYLSFAWDKTLDHRGISANRSILHIKNWLWLIGDEEALRFAESRGNYAQYGAPILKYVGNKYGAKIPSDERAERMARGEFCEPECDNGCER